MLFFFLSGCATTFNPATGRNEFIFVNTATEVSIGKQVAQDLNQKDALSQDLDLQRRVKAIGSRIAAISDRKDLEYNFSVLKDKELNAATFPGGFIYVNKGLVEVLDDNELAYVIAHEVGHVAARHIAKKMQANMGYQLILNIAFAGLSNNPNVSANSQQITGGINQVYNLVSLSYSRKDEFEADRLGVKYAYRAGFDPYASLSALGKIKDSEGPHWKLLSFFKTHPYVDERIKALKTFIPEAAK